MRFLLWTFVAVAVLFIIHQVWTWWDRVWKEYEAKRAVFVEDGDSLRFDEDFMQRPDFEERYRRPPSRR